MKNLIYAIIVVAMGVCSLSGQPVETDLSDAEGEILIVSDCQPEEPAREPISLGIGKITAYCTENYPHICNDGESYKTATGTIPTVGITCAVDPSVIPYGSEVIVNGKSYIAEDCGGAIKGNGIDILFATHEEAMNFGVQYMEVAYISNIGNNRNDRLIHQS